MQNEQAHPPSPPSDMEKLRQARARRWAFRLAALMLPILLCVVVEVSLRLAGFGYPTSFFIRQLVDETNVLAENPKFGWTFFPPAVARSPVPLQVQSPKPPGTLRIFVFGESAALGDPEPAYGFSRQLQRILQARHPANRIEVINVAMTAINSHVIRDIAHDCAPLQGDVWLIYAGNNEVVGPFGAGTVFGPKAPSASVVRAILAAKRSRLGQWLAGLHGDSSASEWQGMELFLLNQVQADDARLARVYRNFGANLSAIVRTGKRAGAKIILSTVAANLRDCPPFGSAHRAGFAQADRQTWEDLVARGREAELSGHFADALALYEKAAQLDSSYAELIFRRATCELNLGQQDKAQTDFARARDFDTLRFRVDGRLNDIIEQTAAAGRVALMDARAELKPANGIPGDEFFLDHVHFNFAGNYKTAISFAALVEKQVFPNNGAAGGFIPEAEVAHQLAFTDFDRRRITDEMRIRFEQPPFTMQSSFPERDRRLAQLLAAPHPAPSESAWEYRAALVLFPADWVLRQNFGNLLETMGDKTGAVEQWLQVLQQLPYEPDAYYHLGNLAYDAGLYEEAADRFRQCLFRRPGSSEARNGLGLVLAAQGRTNEAVAQFNSALKSNPLFSAARVNLAIIFAHGGNVPAALDQYQEVLRLDTNNVAARINMAKLLFGRGQTNEAIALYTRAIELRPDSAVAHFDLANALSAQGRHDEALKHYAAAVENQPGFVDARYNLGIELARAGKVAEALPQFAEVVRLRPGSAEAHFNYGVALAKTQQYQEAAQQFRETLKVDPNHGAARALLEKALQLGSGPLQP